MLLRVRVARMHAVHARRAIETALAGVPGILRLDVRLGLVDIAHQEALDPERVRDAIAAAGFEVVSIEQDTRRLGVVAPESPEVDD